MSQARGYAAQDAKSPLAPFRFARRQPGARDVHIRILYCGICHSDIHQVRDEWGSSTYPMVPGHEIVGEVTRVGAQVRRFKAGDLAGVGCMVDSCRACPSCQAGLEQHCQKHVSFTYNGTEQDLKTPTFGGYSSDIVVAERFVLKVEPGLPLERVAPLLCAGITTYSPLKRWKAGPGRRVAVRGVGGLGHMAVKLAAAMGAEVTVLSGSKSKGPDAKRLGAHEFVLTSRDGALARLAGRFDLIIDTVCAPHDVNEMLGLLKVEGALVLVGASPKPLEVGAFPLIVGRRILAGSLIGGIAETQEMLDFCARHKTLCDVEVIAMKDVNKAYERVIRGDVRYRFSIDLATL
ncbi:MAG: NAD(P)-dependent alcohol dehydrogenase [Elusimicrobia bacterium]|nr:NAD(P)-dependent alcohol dehydrogenase [Elusimicrobiota bacterium]